MDNEHKEREELCQGIAAPLEAAYAKDGRAALEQMEGVEPLFLMNWKIKSYNALAREPDAGAANESLHQQQEKLLSEIADINGWVKQKLREYDKPHSQQSPKQRDRGMERG